MCFNPSTSEEAMGFLKQLKEVNWIVLRYVSLRLVRFWYITFLSHDFVAGEFDV